MIDLESFAANIIADCLPADGKLDVRELERQIDDMAHSAAESACTYYHHCEDIISRYESDAAADTESADAMGREYKPSEYRQAMTDYAFWIARSVIDSNARDIISEIENAAEALESELDSLGVEYDSADFRISTNCLHGWASHNRENELGACFWVSRQLDGCNAVSIPVSGMWLTYTWNPDAMATITATAPSHWASYLINGDASGLDDDEKNACDAWIAREGLGDPVDCSDAGFIRAHDAFREWPLASDCQEYTFIVRAFKTDDGYTFFRWRAGFWRDAPEGSNDYDMTFESGADGMPIDFRGDPLPGALI